MGRKRGWTDDQLRSAVAQNISVAGTLRDLGLGLTGGNYRALHVHVARLGLDTSHWLGQGHMRGKRPAHCFRKRPDAEIFVKDSTYTSGQHLRTRLLAVGVSNVCAICGLLPVWQGQPLVLTVDHINGVPTDNRRENLRLICPNCHSQTPTFSGRNRKQGRRSA